MPTQPLRGPLGGKLSPQPQSNAGGVAPKPRQETPNANPAQPFPSAQVGIAPAKEVCRNYNENRCRFARCRFQHICKECHGPHPLVFCPLGAPAPAGGYAGGGRPSGGGICWRRPTVRLGSSGTGPPIWTAATSLAQCGAYPSDGGRRTLPVPAQKLGTL